MTVIERQLDKILGPGGLLDPNPPAQIPPVQGPPGSNGLAPAAPEILPSVSIPQLSIPLIPQPSLDPAPTSDTISVSSVVSSVSLPLTSLSLSVSASGSQSVSSPVVSSSDTPSPTLAPTFSPYESVYVTDIGGKKSTVIKLVTATSPIESSTAVPNDSPGFLQNKPVMGIVFTVVGIVAISIIFGIVTLVLRKSRRRRLDREAVSFDPTMMQSTLSRSRSLGSVEKSRPSFGSDSSAFIAHNGYPNRQANYGHTQPNFLGGVPTQVPSYHNAPRYMQPSDLLRYNNATPDYPVPTRSPQPGDYEPVFSRPGTIPPPNQVAIPKGRSLFDSPSPEPPMAQRNPLSGPFPGHFGGDFNTSR